MAAISFALQDGKHVSIDDALKLKSSRPSLKLTCPECSQSVRIHRAGGHMPAHFEHRKRNPHCSLSHVTAKDIDKSERDRQPWTDDELRASVVAYLAMLQKLRDGTKVAKKPVYAELAQRFDRTEKSFEYRMQNISYILALVGRTWLPGLRPARNVGLAIATKIESILRELEEWSSPYSVSFEIEVNSYRGQVSRPSGNREPPKGSVTIVRYVRDPHVKAWVLAQANGICESCDQLAPFEAVDGPFLEVHHVQHLADDGPDTISNAIAICPNCHRRLHYSLDAADLVEIIYSKISRLVRS